jgi:hypothetical protein
MKGKLLFVAAVVVLGVALASSRTEAHKPITSPFTYNEDVFPIVRDRCGRCHVSGGVAPMSLLAYKDMVPWGESIRAELVAGHMPPWSVIGGHGGFKNAPILSARELNVLLTWVTGGTPAGNPDHAPAVVALQRDWPLGPPDLVLPLPSEVTLPADTPDRTQEFTVRTGETNTRWVRAADLLPGTPAIVRSATIAIKSDSSTSAPAGGIDPERTLSVWVPGEDPVSLDREAAFQLPPGAELIVRVHYKKTWEYERISCRSAGTSRRISKRSRCSRIANSSTQMSRWKPSGRTEREATSFAFTLELTGRAVSGSLKRSRCHEARASTSWSPRPLRTRWNRVRLPRSRNSWSDRRFDSRSTWCLAARLDL